jgi:hypothetical protein
MNTPIRLSPDAQPRRIRVVPVSNGAIIDLHWGPFIIFHVVFFFVCQRRDVSFVLV